MFLKNIKILCFFLIMTIIFYRADASKCGQYFCKENTECIFDQEEKEMKCVCYDRFMEYKEDNNIECFQPFKCTSVGFMCGPNHICDRNLVCVEANDNEVELVESKLAEIAVNAVCPAAQRCLHQCCNAFEICSEENICVPKEKLECPQSQRCQHKCCALNQVCTRENECENLAIEQTAVSPALIRSNDLSDCPEARKCLEKCCLEEEKCSLSNQCIPLLITGCPEIKICGGKCCSFSETCNDENECVPIAQTIESSECPSELKCADDCCSPPEVCNELNECVTKNLVQLANVSDFTNAMATLDSTNANMRDVTRPVSEIVMCTKEGKCFAEKSYMAECPDYRKCNNTCCALTETCQNFSKCVFVECPAERLCRGNCCAEGQICSNENKCVSTEESVIQPSDPKCIDSPWCKSKCCGLNQFCNEANECETSAIKLNATSPCPEDRKCLDKCCLEQEKCSQAHKCIPMLTIECLETEICGNRCCPVDETCNSADECVPFIEITTIANCPNELKCQDECCAPQEVCNEMKECIYKNPEELTHLNDVTDYIQPISTLDENTQIISCPRDRFPCQYKCCSFLQICNAQGECVEQQSDTDIVEEHNCAKDRNSEHSTDNIISIIYTIIGLGCLVIVFSLALFKVYIFRQETGSMF